MYRTLFPAVLFTLTLLFGINGCQQESEKTPPSDITDQTGIHIEEAWARPGSEGQMSAAYFLITNFDQDSDVLLSIRSDVAQNVEIHESYEREEEMIGMREIQNIEIPGQSTVRLEQGGIHVMLIQLTRQLQHGDTFDLVLDFENHGEQTVQIPVRL